ncbi:MAG TPA: hypothetical protein VF519_01320 [Mycobacteriales bacterium]|jgi:hypothetical protein
MRLCRRLPAAVSALTGVLAAVLVATPAAAFDRTSDSTFGYDVTARARDTLFTSASAVWNVAAATQHVAGEAGSATTWLSLGGGCVADDCWAVRDPLVATLGTEAAVSASGAVTYRAWYGGTLGRTTVPLAVAAGDEVRGTIARVPGVAPLWRLTLENLTAGTSWSTTQAATKPVALSARFMVETTHYADEFGYTYPTMPTLADTRFDEIRLNGAAVSLRPEERVWLVAYMDLDVVAAPSSPQPDGDGFGACAWATSCAVPPNR